MKTAEQEIDAKTDVLDIEAGNVIEVEGEIKAAQADDAAEEDDADEVIISIGEEAPPPEEETRAPEWVRELRKSNREKERKIRELEAKLNATAIETKPIVVGAKPTLESCDYDSDEYETKLADWYERKREADAAEATAAARRDAEAREWNNRLAAYEKAKASLKVRDYEDAEAFALETFNVTQQGIVIQGSDNPALIVYALGKNTKRAKELASITDPVKFAFAVAKLETQLKVSNRKASASPERTITSGGASLSGAVDSTLERLRAEAEKTGDYTKVLQYKRQKRNA